MLDWEVILLYLKKNTQLEMGNHVFIHTLPK